MADRKPNFVVMYCDDLGYGDLGCFGSDAIQTPHLDALASSGARFTDWYSNSPVCSPSRASLLTGRCPLRAGVPHILGGKRGTPGIPPEEITLAEMLKPLGYRTACIGKWHLGVGDGCLPNQHGFEEFYGFLAGCIDYYSHIFYWQQAAGVHPVHDLWHNEKEVWQNGEYFTDMISRKSVEYIGEQGDEPFFLYVPFNAPHYPMHAPKEYVDRYPDLPPDRRIMAAMISAVDDAVGAIVAALKDAGCYDDTVLFFSSDNGPSTEARNWLDGTEDLYYGGSAGVFRGHKGSLFEGGIREPAILSWANGIESGQVLSDMVATMDVLPTFLDILGESPPSDRIIDGESILPMVTQSATGPHERLFWEYGNGNQLAARQGPWKLVLNGKLDFSRTQADDVHLANLDDDPGERVNLKDEQPELTAELTAAAQAWLSELKS